MNPFEKHEPKVKVESRTQGVNLDLVILVGLAVVLLIGVTSGL